MRNYYDILGVQPDASLEEIKRAYKELARRDHPDKNPGSATAEEAFKELSAAYAVLSDPNSRVLYDVYGAAQFEERRAPGAAPWGAPAAAGVEAAPPVYLTAAEIAGGCAKILPLPCPTCGGHGRDIGGACPACAGRGWSAAGPRVRIEVPAGVSPGETLWGEILSGDGHDPVPFTVRVRRDARAASGAGSHAEAPQAARTSPFAAAAPGTDADRRPLSTARYDRRTAAAAPGLAHRLRQVRSRAGAAAERVAQRARRTIRMLSASPPYPVAVQFAAVARALERVGERQIGALEDAARRFAADVTRLGELLPSESAPTPQPARVAEAVRAEWGAWRLAAYALAGALLLGGLTIWLIAATIGELGPAAGLLPGPLAAIRRGWVVGLGLVSLAVLAGIGRRLLDDIQSEDAPGLLVGSLPLLLLLGLVAITGHMFWHAAPTWLQRLGLAAASATSDALPRYGIAAAGGVLMIGLYALGDFGALGISRAAAARARMRADSLLSDRERRLERARAVGIRIREQAQVILGRAAALPDAVRADFGQAVGIEASGSIAESVGDAVQALLGATPAQTSLLPLRRRGGAAMQVTIDLLALGLWALGVVLTYASLAPALAGWAGLGSPMLATFAAFALPLAASLAGLLAKEGLRTASQAALSHRTAPWLGRQATIAAAATAAVVLAALAGWVVARHLAASGDAGFAAFWEGTLVLAVAVAGMHLDASLLAAARLLAVAGLGLAWSGLRLAGAFAGAAEGIVDLMHGGVTEEPPAFRIREDKQRRPA